MSKQMKKDKQKKKLLRRTHFIFLNLLIVFAGFYYMTNFQYQRFRMRNIVRDRQKAITFIRNKDDKWFYKSYRLSRYLFYKLLGLINPILETKNKRMAIISSGDYVKGESLLAATLRFLAGGSYIDLIDLYDLYEKMYLSDI